MRRATRPTAKNRSTRSDFYPRSPCGERHDLQGNRHNTISISIHALLAESDPPRVIREPAASRFLSTLSLRRATARRASRQQPVGISIHALLAESDYRQLIHHLSKYRFLSTLSLRRATLAGPSGPAFLYNFYPRSPCGERHCIAIRPTFCGTISIHALLAESDISHFRQRKTGSVFLSTLSLRRATGT